MDWGGAHIPGTLGACVSLATGATSAAYILPSGAAGGTTQTDPTLVRLLLSVGAGTQGGGVCGTVNFGVIAWSDVNDIPDDVPNLIDFPNLDWIITGSFNYPNYPTALYLSTGAGENGGGWIESSAMRRLGNDKGLLFVLTNFTNASIHFVAHARFLIKE